MTSEHTSTMLGKWSLHRQSRELLEAGDCEYSIWFDGHIVVMADPAFGDVAKLETVVRLCNQHDELVKALDEIECQAVCEPLAGEEECRRMLDYCRELAHDALAKVKP